MAKRSLSFPVRLPSRGPGKVDKLNIYSSERLFNLPKVVFSWPFRVILTVWLTFVVLSLRVQPSSRTASPLWIQLSIPDTVPLHGLLLQQAPPCLLLPHGWWAAVCVPTGFFTPLSWVHLRCFGCRNVSATAAGCVKRDIQGQRSMIQAGSDTKCEKGIRYLGSHYQLPPEISDLWFIWPLHNCMCICVCLSVSPSRVHYWPPLCLLCACLHHGAPSFPCPACRCRQLHLQTSESDFWLRLV